MLLPETRGSDAARAWVLADIERATYLTRAGRHKDAREIYYQYRNDRLFGADVEASLVLMLLDGLITYFGDCDVEGATNRLFRARALGLAYKSDASVAVISAWLAHLYFNAGDHEKMIFSIHEAIQHHALANEFAAERLLLTVADAHSLAGDFVNGRRYYDRARHLASRLGDSLLMAAAAHNRSTLALTHARFADAIGQPLDASISTFLLELKSAENLEKYLRLENVLYPYAVWAARCEMLGGNFEHAMVLLDQYRSDTEEIPLLLKPTVYADLAYCRSKCNDTDTAVDLMNDCLGHELGLLPSDDLAVIFSFGSRVFESVGDFLRRDACLSELAVHRDSFRDETRSLGLLLADLGRHNPFDRRVEE